MFSSKDFEKLWFLYQTESLVTIMPVGRKHIDMDFLYVE